jgi:FkbM family methyltransferase
MKVDKIVFDIGANDGSSFIDEAKENPNTLVFAFEPTPELIDIIKSKTKDLPNYVLVEKAVSNFNGKSTFNVAGKGDWGCSSLLEFSEKSKTHWKNRTDFKVTHQIEVDVITLESFVIEKQIPKIDYLHIDTQGSDLNVLKGLGDFIKIIREGNMEAANKEDILYKGQNTVKESLEFLKEYKFEIPKFESNDKEMNELNIHFMNPNPIFADFSSMKINFHSMKIEPKNNIDWRRFV